MHMDYKIAIVITIVMIIVSVFIAPIIYDNFLKPKQEEPKPEVYLFLTEFDYTPLMHLESLENMEGLEITISPIEAPYSLENVWMLMNIPLQNANLELYENQTLFGFEIQNLGQGIATKAYAYIGFTPPNTILNIESSNVERLKIIQGGRDSSYVKFLIEELYPNERQWAFIYLSDNKLRDFYGWSKEEGDIYNIFHYRIIFSEIE